MTRYRGADKADLDHAEWLTGGWPSESGEARRPSSQRTAAATAAEPRGLSGSGTAKRKRGAERGSAPARRAENERHGTASSRAATKPSRTAARSSRAAVKPTRAPAGDHLAVAPPGWAERRSLLLVTALLLLYGLLMAYSASSAEGYFQYGSSFHFLKRQALWAILGLGAMGVLSRVDYVWYRRLVLPFCAIVAIALVAVLIPGIGTTINGARRWIYIGGQGLQPSELAKIAVVMLEAALIAGRPDDVKTLQGFVKHAAIGIIPAAGLIMLQPDLGSTLVLIIAVTAVIVAGGARVRHLAGFVVTGCLGVLALIVVEPYRMERLTTFLDPWRDPQGAGFQTTQSLISIASGGFTGVGLGNSVQKFGYLPEQGTDMITGIIGEELGLLGLGLLLALYAGLAWACFRIALNCQDLFGKLLATGITTIIIGQACINIGAALGILPLTGVPLPLVSLGGTSLVVVLGGLGILLNIATNRRSYIVVSARRGDRPDRRRRDGWASAAGSRRRG